MTLKDKSILVTGGAGFIGSHLVDRLITENPKKIIVVDNLSLGKKENLTQAKKNFSELKFYKRNAEDFMTMKKIINSNKVDVIFNMAIVPLPASLRDPKKTTDVNLKIVTNLCELQRLKVFKTLIYCSSSEAYGTAKKIPMNEEHPLNPTTPYAASKAAGDHIVLSYHKTFGTDCSIIRPFNNYGPRQNRGSYAGVIPLTIKRVLKNQSPIIYGDGKQTRDYIYVTDTARMAIEIYKNEGTRGKIINIGSGKEITILTLIKTIMRLLNFDKNIKFETERPGDVRRHRADINLAVRLLKFKQEIDFEDGIKKTINWYKKEVK